MTNTNSPAWAGEEHDPARIFSAEELIENFMGNAALVRSLLVRFMERTERQMAEVPLLVERGDWETAVRDAHTIKGSARSLCAPGLGDAAARWEEACKTGDTLAVWALVPEMTEAFDRFKAAVDQYLADTEDRT
ncbi:MAG: Hpt domain-containing protein [Treponema sp.]|jgi:HPt (histidine-containing phosphotransfer) domain-containing protein|nr:Hpt domain-containing protein [Treponema sp.]